MVLEKTLESPLDFKEIQLVHPKRRSVPGCSLERLMLKLQSFCYLMWRTDSLEKTLMLGKIEGRRRRTRQRVRWLDVITDLMTWIWASSGSWWWTVKPGELQSMGSQRVGHDWATELNCKTGCWRRRWLNGITNAMDLSLGQLQEIVRDRGPGVLQSMGLQRVGHNWETKQQQLEISGNKSC